MADDAQTRRLATIVALDVAGYSARTEADEARTTAQIALLRPVIEGIAKAHGGRVFNTAGDGFMLEFASSLSAVSAGLELADECRPRVRVGVHVGEVVVQPNGDLLGHGVNVAARLMAKAEPGSAIISADVCRMIRGPLAERFVSRGPVQLDKMAETIEIFAPAAPAHVTVPPAPPKSAPATTHAWPRPTPRLAAMIGVPLLLVILAVVLWSRSGPSSPATMDTTTASIAVLPFENLSTDKDNAFFAVGIQDEILTRLSKIGALRVISRTSTAHLASRPENVAEIASQLGVTNILEGSVQRAGDMVRVNVQLIKAGTDSHLWAEVYDRKLDNIFSVQTEIATAVAEALNAKVTGSEQKALAQRPTNNVAAYDAYLRGLAFDHQEKGDESRASYKEAVRLDPDFALAWTAFAVRAASASFGSSNPALSAEAVAAVETARRLKPDMPELHLAQGAIDYYINEDYDAARAQFEQGHAAQPNDVESIYFLGLIARRQGRWDDSRALFEQAIARDPMRADLRLSLHELLVATRDVASASRVIDDAMNRWPDSQKVIATKLEFLFSLGELDQADALLKAQGARAGSDFAAQLIKLATARRKYSEAILVALAALNQKAGASPEAQLRGSLALLYNLSGDAKGARPYLEAAKSFWQHELAAESRNRTALRYLALLAALEGERETALRYMDKAISLLPTSKDRYSGPDVEENRMKILARLGDRDGAIAEIARLLKTSYDRPLTPAELRLDPVFDKLRGDPRFEALLK